MYPVCLSCESDGRLACQQQLKYYTVLNVRSTRGKNSHGRKVTGIESMPGEEKVILFGFIILLFFADFLAPCFDPFAASILLTSYLFCSQYMSSC